jgi:hypothetical protein
MHRGPHLSNAGIRGLGVVLALACTFVRPALAQSDARSQENLTKAAMIYNFARFAAWPDSRFSRRDGPVTVCVDPAEPLAGALATIDGKPIEQRTLTVRRTARVDDACQMAFVSAASANEAYLTNLSARGILTIGEAPNFTQAGAIQLVTIGRQVRFSINQRVALASGVHLSSNLLRLAVSVR